MRCRSCLLMALLALGSSAVLADDWPGWLGPQQSATWKADGIRKSFPEDGLPVKWRAEVAWGYSGPAVANGRVFLTDFLSPGADIANNPGAEVELEGQERIHCFAADDGSPLWTYAYPVTYHVSYPGGPRVTPTVDGDRVYTLGTEGHLFCLTTDKGEVVWSKELKGEYRVEAPYWGYSAAPLVDGNRLYVMVGGQGHCIVALDKNSGRELWRALSSEDAGYATPTLIEAGGTRQLIVWTPETINGLNPETGDVHWSLDLKPDFRMAVTLPRHEENLLFASGIGNVGAAIRLEADRPHAEIAWRGRSDTAVYCSNSTPHIVEGVIYGNDCRTGNLVAARLDNGERLWETQQATSDSARRTNHGTVFLVRLEGTSEFLLFNENGYLIRAKLTPEGYEEIARTQILEPTNEAFGRKVVWSHPAYADQSIFARNDRELVCVSLADNQ